MIKIDDVNGLVIVEAAGQTEEHKFNTPRAFEIISNAWLKCGWDAKYVYSFSWLGRPIIQLPEDMVRIQEIIFELRPSVIVETGVAHGGSLIYYASLLKAMDIPGKVIGVDIDIRAHNRTEIENHNLYSYIELIEGSSIDDVIVEKVANHISQNDTVLVILDSCHSKQHVLDELRCYSGFVTKDSYVVVTDGIMGQVVGRDRTEEDWIWNNPAQAALAFVDSNSCFELAEPKFVFNEGVVTDRVTYWPNCYVKRVK